MRRTVLRGCLGAIALIGTLSLVAACSGQSGSTLLSPTGVSGALRSSAGADFNTFPSSDDPCAATTAGEDFSTNPGEAPPPPCLLNGRFTGGGFQIDANGLKVTRGFTLHCDARLSNNFEVNWKGADGNAHHFHTDKNPVVTECSKPVIPNPPAADVSRIVILNQPGKFDGVDGSVITIVLEDHGEPGTSDRAFIAVNGNALTGGSVEIPALIDGGNIQAHFDQPHKNK